MMDRKTPHEDLLKAASPDHLGVILDKNGIADKIYSHLNGRYSGEVKSAEEINAFLKNHLNGLRMTDGFFVRTFENLSFAVKEDGTNTPENQKAYNVAQNMSLFISTIGEVRLLEGEQAIFSAAQDVKAVDVSNLCRAKSQTETLKFPLMIEVVPAGPAVCLVVPSSNSSNLFNLYYHKPSQGGGLVITHGTETLETHAVPDEGINWTKFTGGDARAYHCDVSLKDIPSKANRTPGVFILTPFRLDLNLITPEHYSLLADFFREPVVQQGLKDRGVLNFARNLSDIPKWFEGATADQCRSRLADLSPYLKHLELDEQLSQKYLFVKDVRTLLQERVDSIMHSIGYDFLGAQPSAQVVKNPEGGYTAVVDGEFFEINEPKLVALSNDRIVLAQKGDSLVKLSEQHGELSGSYVVLRPLKSE